MNAAARSVVVRKDGRKLRRTTMRLTQLGVSAPTNSTLPVAKDSDTFPATVCWCSRCHANGHVARHCPKQAAS